MDGTDPTEVFSNSDYDSEAELISQEPDVPSEQHGRAAFKESSLTCPLESSLAGKLCPCLARRQNYTPQSPRTSSQHDSTDSSAPRDRLHLVYLCFFMAGAGFLFPFNSYITAVDYFHSLYKREFSSVSEVIPMTYLVVTLFASTLNLSLVERLPVYLRILFGYVMFSIALFFVLMLDIGIHNCTVSTHVSYYLTLASVVVVGLGSGCESIVLCQYMFCIYL